MEDKRTAFAILLIIVVVMMYSELVIAPTTRPITPAQRAPVSAITSSTASSSTSAPTAPISASSTTSSLPSLSTQVPVAAPQPAATSPSDSEIEGAGVTTVETDRFVARLSSLGARLISFKLKDYRDRLGAPDLLDMVHHRDGTPLPLGLSAGQWSDERVLYELRNVSPQGGVVRVPANGEGRLQFVARLPDGDEIEKTLTVKGDSYLFGVEVRLSQPTKSGELTLEWNRYLPEEVALDRVDPWSFTVFSAEDRVRHLLVHDVTGAMSNPFQAHWVAFSDKYFTGALAGSAGLVRSALGRSGTVFRQQVSGGSQSGNFQVYLGPKDYRILAATGLQLERSIDLGFFSFLAYPLLVFIRILYQYLGNFGLAIVTLTLLIKGIFFPLTRASLNSAKAMQELQPEMKALRERISDPTQLNQEMMALYKRRGVNPLGGCLPIFIQIPVFFGLYSALQHSIELRHAPFALWINDLSAKEHLLLAGINVPVLVLIMGIAMFYQQWSTPMPTMDPQQRKMMLWISAIFPVSFLIYPFPSGLALYMVTNMSISIVQQRALRASDHPSPGRVTALASVAIFLLALVLTLL